MDLWILTQHEIHIALFQFVHRVSDVIDHFVLLRFKYKKLLKVTNLITSDNWQMCIIPVALLTSCGQESIQGVILSYV